MTSTVRLAGLHNRIAGDIVKSIVRPPLDAGGDVTHVLVLLESVILGVVLACVKLGGDEIVLDEVVGAVKSRLAEQRLRPLPPVARMTDRVPPLPMIWDGEHFAPASPHWAKEADKHLVVGALYQIDLREERSQRNHNHYFAALAEAHRNLPEEIAERLPTVDHLRKFALMKCGYRDERSIVCASEEEAKRMAAFITPLDSFAIVAASGRFVTVWTAQSQSMKAMDRETFQASKEKVLDFVAGLIGTSSGDLERNAGQAA